MWGSDDDLTVEFVLGRIKYAVLEHNESFIKEFPSTATPQQMAQRQSERSTKNTEKRKEAEESLDVFLTEIDNRRGLLRKADLDPLKIIKSAETESKKRRGSMKADEDRQTLDELEKLSKMWRDCVDSAPLSNEQIDVLCKATSRVTQLKTPRALQLKTALTLWHWDDTKGHFSSQEELVSFKGGGNEVQAKELVMQRPSVVAISIDNVRFMHNTLIIKENRHLRETTMVQRAHETMRRMFESVASDFVPTADFKRDLLEMVRVLICMPLKHDTRSIVIVLYCLCTSSVRRAVLFSIPLC